MNDFAAMNDTIRAAIQESVEVKTRLLTQANPTLARIAVAMAEAFRNGGKVILFGNGGSAADAQHVAAELVNEFLLDRRALPALALTTDTPLLTAISNDVGFEHVFARQVEALVQPGDVVVGLSTSERPPGIARGPAVWRHHRRPDWPRWRQTQGRGRHLLLRPFGQYPAHPGSSHDRAARYL
jgi:D-sedoheptulose 7-phosphate isomerase